MTAEEHLSCSLRTMLAQLAEGDRIPESEAFRAFESALEYFLPGILAEVDPEFWRWGESFDGFWFDEARKTGPGEAEMIGFALLISDQTFTPIHLQLQHAETAGEISRLECRLGSKDESGRMTRIPYRSPKKIQLTRENLHAIDWVYHVGFGERWKPPNDYDGGTSFKP